MREFLLSHLSATSNRPLAGALSDTPPWFWLLVLFALLVAITVHEFGHAWMADKLGDPGPRAAGRVTLNPLAHLDPLGTLIIIVTTLAGFPVGWGKPVKTDPDLYTVDRRKGMALVAAAGPAMNFVTAVLLAPLARLLLARLLGGGDDFVTAVLFAVTGVTMLINLSLFVFNLVPVYPLDGSHIAQGLLPAPLANAYGKFMQRYGVFVFLGLMLTGVFRVVIGPIIVALFYWLLGVHL